MSSISKQPVVMSGHFVFVLIRLVCFLRLGLGGRRNVIVLSGVVVTVHGTRIDTAIFLRRRNIILVLLHLGRCFDLGMLCGAITIRLLGFPQRSQWAGLFITGMVIERMIWQKTLNFDHLVTILRA